MERAFLVIIEFKRFGSRGWSLVDEEQELHELAKAAGCSVVGTMQVRRHVPVAHAFIGSGKLEEIADAARQARAQVVVFNREVSASQQRNIEDVLGVKMIDRTQLILDIFAQRARSQEGRVQVELAQLRYLMPRLIGKGVLLSRLGGGIGTRGPGEQKLEVDRRRIRQRITRLSDELKQLDRRRAATRQRRQENRVPVIALVGYTNAGKTTLLNRLTGAGSRSADQLFTTLDPLARRFRLPHGDWTIVTDTVGFLQRLPHHLIEAFKATLEEARDADLLLHVLDASHPLAYEQAQAVYEVLGMLELDKKPVVTVLNKIDRLADRQALQAFGKTLPSTVPISALSGEGIETLLAMLEDRLPKVDSTAGLGPSVPVGGDQDS